MYQALAVPELFDMVLQDCSSDPATLASLARTCRTLQEASLSTLYGSCEVELTSIVKSCLPGVVYKQEDEDANDGYCYGIDEDVSALELQSWDRFYFYKARVKNLKVTYSELWPEIFVAISIHCHRSNCLSLSGAPFSILQSLHVVHSDSRRSFSFLHCLPFFTGTLRRLVLECGPCSNIDELEPLRWSLAVTCPHLDTLSVEHFCDRSHNYYMYEAENHENLLPRLLQQSRIWKEVTLSLDEIERPSLHNILTLPSLERLTLRVNVLQEHRSRDGVTVRIWPTDEEGDVDALLALEPLQSLELAMNSSSFGAVSSILAKTKLRPSRRISISLSGSGRVEDVFEGLAGQNRSDLVDSFSLSLYGDRQAEINFDDVQLLFGLENFKEFKITGAYFYLDDNDFLSIASHWTGLTVLHVGYIVLSDGPTLYSLVHLAIHCAHLVELYMEFDARRVPYIKVGDKRRLSNTVFNRLFVGESEISNPTAVRKFVKTVFPTIQLIECDPDWDNGSDTGRSVSSDEQVESNGSESNDERRHKWSQVLNVDR